jgi:acetyl-CoA C-acetyltransferase
MTIHPRTPVLVGAAAVQQHKGADGDEPVELMIQALRRAADESGKGRLLRQMDVVAVPRGTWTYSDPGRLISEAVSARGRTVLGQLGVLQQTLMTRACEAIAESHADIVAVVGGEARARSRDALRAGRADPQVADTDSTPDEILVPEGDILDSVEIQRALGVPAHQYAVMENALRAADGQTLDDHADAIAELWADFSRIASGNPDAWTDTSVGPAALRNRSQSNRLISFPYNRLHVSQWNVNQAAALIFASAERATDLGIPRDRWVFPLSAAESNSMIPLIRRRDLHRCPAVRVAGTRALVLAGVDLDDITYLDLYSCFPVAVRIQARELDLPDDRPLTVTGGMTFAGGPLNNYVLQATVKMTELLRADSRPGSLGLVSSVSGMLTKQAFSVWSNRPPATQQGFAWADVSATTKRQTETRPVCADYDGPATVAGYTVIGGAAGPERAVVIADLPDKRRTAATSEDVTLAEEMTRSEWCGRAIDVRGGAFHSGSS